MALPLASVRKSLFCFLMCGCRGMSRFHWPIRLAIMYSCLCTCASAALHTARICSARSPSLSALPAPPQRRVADAHAVGCTLHTARQSARLHQPHRHCPSRIRVTQANCTTPKDRSHEPTQRICTLLGAELCPVPLSLTAVLRATNVQ